MGLAQSLDFSRYTFKQKVKIAVIFFIITPLIFVSIVVATIPLKPYALDFLSSFLSTRDAYALFSGLRFLLTVVSIHTMFKKTWPKQDAD